MNPHVVSAKALNQTTTRQAGVNGANWPGFRLQLSRAIPIHGGCLTKLSANQNHHQGRLVVRQPLWLQTPRIAPSTIAPLVLLNRRVARFTSGPRKHVISNPLLAKSGLANVATFLGLHLATLILDPVSSKTCLQLVECRGKMVPCFGS